MTLHPHVRELVRFEEQRLATAIECSASPEHDPSTTSVVVRWPHPDALTDLAILPGPGGASWRLRITPLISGDPFCVGGESEPVAIASVEENIVRLAFDPNHLVAHGEKTLLTHLWDQAVAPALEKAARHARETADTAQVEAFTRLEQRWHCESLGRLPGAIESNEHSLVRLESQMRELIERTGDMRRQERALQLVGHDSLRATAMLQWIAVRRLVPEVYRSVELRGATLVALTREITIDDGDMSVDVGEFAISIDVALGTLSITNRTRPVGSGHHPHVRTPSEPCWGNLHPGVMRLLAEREWAGLLSVVHRFLNSYNSRDAYLRLEQWDPDHTDSDDEDYDNDEEEEADDDTVECSICLEHVAPDEITHVQDEPVCSGCLERDTFICGGCSGRFTSANQARQSLRCTGCAVAPPVPVSQEAP